MSGKKRKGLSVDDKRKVILGLYHDRKEPFNLKELETIGSRLGVVQQTIKDINQSLIDDFLVLSDKIGSANFYWSFPSKYYQDQKNLKESLNISIEKVNDNIEDIKRQIKFNKNDRNDPNRNEKLKELEALKREESILDSKLEEMKFNDPEEIELINKQVKINQECANRWTDNTWTVKSYLTKKKGMNGKEVDKLLKIDGTFDYVVYEIAKVGKVSKK